MKAKKVEKIFRSLEGMGFEGTGPQSIKKKTKTCLQRMMDYKTKATLKKEEVQGAILTQN
jgi:hypothetical protein